MKTLRHLFLAILQFGLCFFIEKIVFGILYYFVAGFPQNMLQVTFYSSVLGNINDRYSNNYGILVVYVMQLITELILFSVFTSYVFAFILNREPKIVFPDKLVIRHRTSEGSNGLLYLCIMIGNKSRVKIRNAVCVLSCYYVQDDDPKKTNGEFKIKMEQPSIDNYFRFFFAIDALPHKIIKDYITNDNTGLKNDVIRVYLSGNTNTLGNSFLVEKKYTLNDIVIGENYVDLKYDVINIFTGKPLYKKVKWKDFKRIDDVDKKQKSIIKKEIHQIIK